MTRQRVRHHPARQRGEQTARGGALMGRDPHHLVHDPAGAIAAFLVERSRGSHCGGPERHRRHATCSKLWLGHVGYSRHAMPRVSKTPCSEHAMPNRDPVGYLTVADLQRPRCECYERRESVWPSLATSLPRVHLAVCAQPRQPAPFPSSRHTT
jgi:hypothetical protein